VHRETLLLSAIFLIGNSAFPSSRISGAEPIVIPEAFAAHSQPLPKSWHGRELAITIESVPTGTQGVPQLRVAKSSGDQRADRIAIAYATYILQAKPDLRQQNATNMLTFPMIIDGGLKGGPPRRALHKHASLNKPKGGFKDRTASRFESVK
jgi:hypothetical protein